jgi:tetratricopeptide (TPR) repeat protein
LLRDTGDPSGAEESLRRAIAILNSLVDSRPHDPNQRSELARAYLNLGTVEMATQRARQAEETFSRAAAILERLVSDYPRAPDYREDLTKCANNRGILAFRAGRPDRAQSFFEQVLEIHQHLVRDHPQSIAYREGLARGYLNLGNLHGATGRQRLAAANYEQARNSFGPLARDHPDVLIYQNQLAACENNLGELYRAEGKLDAAEGAQRHAVAIREQLVRDHPDRLDFAIDLSGSWCNLGSVQVDRGQATTALSWFDRGVAILKPILAREPQNTVAAEFLVSALSRRADALTGLGLTEKALTDWNDALPLDDGQQQLTLRVGHAYTVARSGRHSIAATELEQLSTRADSDQKVLLTGARAWAFCSSVAGTDPALAAQGRQALADRYARQAIAWLQRSFRTDLLSGPSILLELNRLTDFDSLRRRNDFQALLADLAFPADPFAR